MELEEEMQKLNQEVAYLADVIKKLDGLSDYSNLAEYLPEVKQLIKKLKVKKKSIKAKSADIMEELIEVAEAYSIADIDEN